MLTFTLPKALAALLAIALLTIPVGIAFADEGIPPTPAPTSDVEGPMSVNCDKMNSEGLKAAQQLGLCLSTGDGMTPDYAEKVGNCGISWMSISNPASGEAQFDFGASSTLGPIAMVSWNVNWVNWSTSNTGAFAGFDFWASSTWYQSRRTITGAGLVTASLTGEATLWNSILCTIGPVTDSRYINWW